MMSKEAYVSPDYEIIVLDRKDVITQSGGGDWDLPPIVGSGNPFYRGGDWDGER